MYTWAENPSTVNKKILSTLQNALWNSTVLKIVYRKIDSTKKVTLNPLGLVCKEGVWYFLLSKI